MSAAEHFAWSVERAMEYVALDDGGNALASLVSDLDKHPGTAHIMTQELQMLFMGEVLVAGARGAKRFIEGIPAPMDGAS